MMTMILQMLHAAQATNTVLTRPDEDQPELRPSARRFVSKTVKEIVIVNRSGLHLRQAAGFALVANRFRSDVWVENVSPEVNGKSILELTTLGAAQGSRLRIRIEGVDGSQAMQAIERLIQSWSDEDRIQNRKNRRLENRLFSVR
jgi:phosphocarrier protein HPr